MKAAVAVAALAVVTGAAPLRAQQPAGVDAAWREVAAHFQRRVVEEGIVGGSLWLISDGKAIGRVHHGFADLETRRRVDDNTIYHWASITKTFTGVAVMQLRDRRRLSLSDTVLHRLPELRAVHNPYGPMEAITLRQLLSHSSGFRGPTWPWGGDEPWHPHEPTRWDQLVAMMPYTEILFPPGSRFGYSNPGIVFLGRIIEQLSGDDFEVYMDKNVLKPLGMYRSYYDLTPYHLLRYRSNNYTIRQGDTVAHGLDFDTGITTSNGGLNAPVPDMVKYLSFLMGSGDRATNEGVLRRSSLEEMWRPVVPVPRDSSVRKLEAEAWELSMGLTYFLYQRGGRKIVSHSGGQKSFSTIFYVEPATRVAAIAAFNTDGEPRPDVDGLMTELRERLLGQVFPLFPRSGTVSR